MATVAVVAFAPFFGRRVNQAGVQAVRLRDANLHSLRECEVDRGAVDACVRELAKLDVPVLWLGETPTRPSVGGLTIECRARNRLDLQDGRGVRAIDKGSDASTVTVLDEASARAMCPDALCHTSRNAGQFLCNYAMWKMWERLKPGQWVFVHVPREPLPGDATHKGLVEIMHSLCQK